MEHHDVPRLEGVEGRRQRAPRGPTLRSLVRLALKCDSAEQMGQGIERFERQQWHQGVRPRQSESQV
jgi:hypothetical protein